MRWIKLPDTKLNDFYEPFPALDFTRKGQKWTVYMGRSFADLGPACLFIRQDMGSPLVVSLTKYLETKPWDCMPRVHAKIIDVENGSILYNVYKEFVRVIKNASRKTC